MLQEMILYHRWTIEALLLVVLMNLILPRFLRSEADRMIFWSRIGYFTFWAFLSMGIFTGLVLYVFAKQMMTFDIIVMLIAGLVLGFLDGYRSIKSRRLWRQGNDGIMFSSVIIIIEIVIVIAVAMMAIQS